MIVVDASVAVKWLIREADSTSALRFLRRYHGNLHAPDLFFVEVASAVVRRANASELKLQVASRTLRMWSALWGAELIQRHFINPRRLLDAGRLALDLKHPLKDCIYLALAMEHDWDLATADAKFLSRAASTYPKLRLLRDYDGAGDAGPEA